MTREQKSEWVVTASNEDLISQLIRSAKMKAVTAERFGFFDERTRKHADDVALIKTEILKRLGGTEK